MKKNEGITLIALVVTIIVLIILAGVSISLVIGENGIITKATEAKEKNEKAADKEAISLAVVASQMKDTSGSMIIIHSNLDEELSKQLGENKQFETTDNGDGSFFINIEDGSKIYYVEDNGNIIEKNDMLKISTVEELKAFRDDVNSGNTYEGKYVYLANDITLDVNEEWTPIGIYPQDIQNTILITENEGIKPFSGIFDGCGYTIDNIYINNSFVGQGLFGLCINAQIKNVNLGSNSSIKASLRSGGIVGIIYNTGIISNCNNYADLEEATGSIVGTVAGQITIQNCKNYGDLSNSYGGIVGSSNGNDWEQFKNVHSTIINCVNYGKITKTSSSDFLGGITGFFKGNIYNSFNASEINMNSEGRYTGGIVGNNEGEVLNCYNIGNVTSQGRYVGGITGITGNKMENCYNIGNITGNISNDLNGCNREYSSIINCYSKNDTFSHKDLGTTFKADIENINNGYPILSWQ